MKYPSVDCAIEIFEMIYEKSVKDNDDKPEVSFINIANMNEKPFMIIIARNCTEFHASIANEKIYDVINNFEKYKRTHSKHWLLYALNNQARGLLDSQLEKE